MSHGFKIVLVFLPLLAFAGAWMAWYLRRSGRMVDRWAAEIGCRVVSRKYRWLFSGPFWWRTTRNMAIYYVTLEDAGGRTRHAYVRCGS